MLRRLRSSYWRAVAATKCRASLLMMAQAHKFVATAQSVSLRAGVMRANATQQSDSPLSRSGFSYKVGLPES